jgi:hypothetical protein
MNANVPRANWLLGLAGGAVGGVAGLVLFYLLAHFAGLYAPLLPGASIGLGCGLLSRGKSVALGVVCGVLGAGLGIFTEWHFFPFIADESLGYFLSHLHQLPPVTLVLIALGAVFAFWLGMGRQRGVRLSDVIQ